jgi:hypothetical protein
MKNLQIELNEQILDFEKSSNDWLTIKYEIDECNTFSEFGEFVRKFTDKIILPIGYKSCLFFDELKCVSGNKIINIYFKFKKKQND